MKPGETITADVYCRQLERLNEKIKVKRPILFNRKDVILHHDNARPHKEKITQEKIQELKWEVLPQPSIFSRPCSFRLFSLQVHGAYVKEKHFRNITEVENHLTEYFESKPENFLKNGFEKLQGRWETIANKDRDYIL